MAKQHLQAVGPDRWASLIAPEAAIALSWADVEPKLLASAVAAATGAGAALLFSRTSDGGALALTILDGQTKTKLYPSGTQVAEAVAKGEREFGIGLASDAVVVPGLTTVPLPAEIQRYTKYTLGVVSNSRSPDAAKALVAFLISSTAKQALAAHGFEVQ